jgi:hypothetical protein
LLTYAGENTIFDFRKMDSDRSASAGGWDDTAGDLNNSVVTPTDLFRGYIPLIEFGDQCTSEVIRFNRAVKGPLRASVV